VGFVANTVSATVGIVITFVDNVYSWFYQLWDWAGNTFATGNRTLTVDLTSPGIYNITIIPINKHYRSSCKYNF